MMALVFVELANTVYAKLGFVIHRYFWPRSQSRCIMLGGTFLPFWYLLLPSKGKSHLRY